MHGITYELDVYSCMTTKDRNPFSMRFWSLIRMYKQLEANISLISQEGAQL